MKMSALLGLILAIAPFVSHASDDGEPAEPRMEEMTVTAKASDAIAVERVRITVPRPEAIEMDEIAISAPAPDLTLVALIDEEPSAADESGTATR